MEFKWYGKIYEDLDLWVERYNKQTDVYVCRIVGDDDDDLGWLTVPHINVDLCGTELVATTMHYVGTTEDVDEAA